MHSKHTIQNSCFHWSKSAAVGLGVAFLAASTIALGVDGGNTTPVSESQGMGLLRFLGLAALAIAICIYTVHGAYRLKFVFFYNNLDLLASTVTPLVGILLAYIGPDSIAGWIFAEILGAAILWNFIAGFRFNPGDHMGALCVGISRNIIGIAVPLYMILQYITGNAKRPGESDLAHVIRTEIQGIKKLLILAALGWFLKSLVNGAAVSAHRAREFRPDPHWKCVNVSPGFQNPHCSKHDPHESA